MLYKIGILEKKLKIKKEDNNKYYYEIYINDKSITKSQISELFDLEVYMHHHKAINRGYGQIHMAYQYITGEKLAENPNRYNLYKLFNKVGLGSMLPNNKRVVTERISKYTIIFRITLSIYTCRTYYAAYR
eukprot:GHVR01153850.1.p1 GENE.GHVR01153850.1~~GHVR01153850.1.p1  ORF type:complete len:131 (-),score=5.15 GHVR01153850.1:331-723(-)